jgi:hypothetical protein
MLITMAVVIATAMVATTMETPMAAAVTAMHRVLAL